MGKKKDIVWTREYNYKIKDMAFENWTKYDASGGIIIEGVEPEGLHKKIIDFLQKELPLWYVKELAEEVSFPDHDKIKLKITLEERTKR